MSFSVSPGTWVLVLSFFGFCVAALLHLDAFLTWMGGGFLASAAGGAVEAIWTALRRL